MAVAAIGVVGAVCAAFLYARLMTEVFSDDPFKSVFVAPYAGWQVDLMAAGIAAALLIVGVSSMVRLVRVFRRLRGRTRNRRVPLWIALLPGLVAGGLAAQPMKPALSWASEQTMQARAARAHAARWLAAYRKAPFSIHTEMQAAPASVADRLLTIKALGKGWYDMTAPNPALVPANWPGASSGVRLRAQSQLTLQHWTGTSWSLEADIFERLANFDTAAHARAYLASWAHQSGCGCAQTTHPTRAHVIRESVLGVSVWERSMFCGCQSGHNVAFQIGDSVITLTVYQHTGDETAQKRRFSALRRAAVHRAKSSD